MLCPKCGAVNSDDAIQCSNCGSALRAEVAEPPSASTEPPRTSGMAIASLVLSLLGCLGLPALIAIVLGAVALRQINTSNGRLTGSGFAVAGMVIGAVMLILSFIIGAMMAAVMFPMFARAREKALALSCQSNIKQICLGILMYSQDYDEKFPLATNWEDIVVSQYIKDQRVAVCPKAPTLRSGYAYNAQLSGRERNTIKKPAETVAILESDKGWNAAGGRELLPSPPRHVDGDNYGFVDGHVRWFSRRSMRQSGFPALQ